MASLGTYEAVGGQISGPSALIPGKESLSLICLKPRHLLYYRYYRSRPQLPSGEGDLRALCLLGASQLATLLLLLSRRQRPSQQATARDGRPLFPPSAVHLAMYSRQTAVISTDPASGEELSSYAQQSYPSPEELHHQAMYGSLFASPTLYDRHELDNEQEFVQQLATPASLLHESPLFDETPWGGASSAVEEDLGGLERQLALERELGFDLGRDSGADARLWDTIHEPVGLETTSTTFSYSPEAFSLSLSDSTPLSSPPSALYDSAPPSPHVSAPFPSTIPPAPSAAFTALANKALECRRARAETTPGSPSTSNDIRRARSSSSQTASKKASSDPNKNNYSCGTCGITIAQLNLRGKGDCLNVPLVAEYWCLRCAPPPGGPGAPKDDAPPVRYEETLSGMLDEMQGVNSARSEDPLLRWRPRADKEERVLVCK